MSDAERPPGWTPPEDISPPDSPLPPAHPMPPPMPPVGFAPPVAPWAPPAASPPIDRIPGYAGGPPPFTIGALVRDSVARFGADPIRLLLLSAIATVLSLASSFVGFAMNPVFGGRVGAGGSGPAGLLTVLSFIVGLAISSAIFALLEGGPKAPFGRVARRGIERSVWLFVTSLLLGLAIGGVVLVAFILGFIFLFTAPPVALVVFLGSGLVAAWLGIRLGLALPATVADNLPGLDALRLSWRITARAGVWLRILGAFLVLGLLIAPIAIGAAALGFVAIFDGQPLLLLPGAVALIVVTPLSSLPLFAAYRRLVPPLQPSLAQPAPAAGATLGPTFMAPSFGGGATAVLALLLALAIGGVVSSAWVLGELAAGRITLPRFPIPGSPGFPTTPGFPNLPGLQGQVAPGEVAFGTSSSLFACTIQGRSNELPAAGPIVWIAQLSERTSLADDVRVRISLFGSVLVDEPQEPGRYDCIGTNEPEFGLEPGTYTFEVLVNGQVEAFGTLLAT